MFHIFHLLLLSSFSLSIQNDSDIENNSMNFISLVLSMPWSSLKNSKFGLTWELACIHWIFQRIFAFQARKNVQLSRCLGKYCEKILPKYYLNAWTTSKILLRWSNDDIIFIMYNGKNELNRPIQKNERSNEKYLCVYAVDECFVYRFGANDDCFLIFQMYCWGKTNAKKYATQLCTFSRCLGIEYERPNSSMNLIHSHTALCFII